MFVECHYERRESLEYKELSKAVMNPVRQRIIQYLISNGKGTSNEILQVLADVPPASLYRHIKKLLDTGLIQIIEERKVRGTIEKTYALVQNPFDHVPTNQEIGAVFYQTLLSMQSTFLRYFENEEADPQKDMLLLQTSTLMLTDEEFGKLLTDIGALISACSTKKGGGDRKVRRLSFVSSPEER